MFAYMQRFFRKTYKFALTFIGKVCKKSSNLVKKNETNSAISFFGLKMPPTPIWKFLQNHIFLQGSHPLPAPFFLVSHLSYYLLISFLKPRSYMIKSGFLVKSWMKRNLIFIRVFVMKIPEKSFEVLLSFSMIDQTCGNPKKVLQRFYKCRQNGNV